MKKQIPIDNKYFAEVEVNGTEILLWISEYYTFKVLWLFPVKIDRKVSWIKLFHLGDYKEDKASCSLTGLFNGRIQTLTINQRNTKTFDLEAEIALLFHAFMEHKKRQDRIQKEIDQLFI